MSTRYPFYALILLLCLSALPAQAQNNLRTFQSEFYEIHTDMARERVIPFGRHMDRIFAAYRDRFSNFRSRRAGAMPLYLLRNREGYVRFMNRQGINAANSGGMFFVQGDIQGLATWATERSRSETFAVLQHEGFHQFAYNYLGTNLPIWANEGIAQYFEDAIITDRGPRLGLADARRIGLVRQAIESGSIISLDELLSTSHADWNRTLQLEPYRASLLYAQAWSVVYFLVHHNNQTRAAFEQYLQLVSSGRHSEQAFRAAFGMDSLAPVQQIWAEFAVEQEPDAINVALTRMGFLGESLRYLKEDQDAEMPSSLEELRQRLQQLGFSMTRTSHGLEVEFEASNEELYEYPSGRDQTAAFELLEASADDLPPRISAPGLNPRPTLVWSRNEEGELVQDVSFR